MPGANSLGRIPSLSFLHQILTLSSQYLESTLSMGDFTCLIMGTQDLLDLLFLHIDFYFMANTLALIDKKLNLMEDPMLKKFALSVFCFGLISSSPVMAGCADNNSEFIAAVLDVEGSIEVWINTREHWNKNGSLVDSYSRSEATKVNDIIDSVNLCNLAESQYSDCGHERSVKQLKQELEQACVQIDPEFQRWAEDEVKN